VWKLICQIWTAEKLSSEWRTTVICSIHKKGDKQDYNNYRGIALISTAYKVFLNYILSRLRIKAEQTIGDY